MKKKLEKPCYSISLGFRFLGVLFITLILDTHSILGADDLTTPSHSVKIDGSPRSRRPSSLFLKVFEFGNTPAALVRTREGSDPSSRSVSLSASPTSTSSIPDENRGGVIPMLELESDSLVKRSLRSLSSSMLSSPVNIAQSPPSSSREAHHPPVRRGSFSSPREIETQKSCGTLSASGTPRISTIDFETKVFRELNTMSETTLPTDPALQMLRFEFFRLMESHKTKDENVEEQEQIKQEAFSYFQKWEEDFGSVGGVISSDVIFDRFWRMTLTAFLKEYMNQFGVDTLKCVGQSAQFLAESCQNTVMKKDFFKISGEIYEALGARNAPSFYVDGAQFFFRAGLFDRALSCLDRMGEKAKDPHLTGGLCRFGIEVVSQPDLTLLTPPYQRLFKYLENYYLTLPNNKNDQDVRNFFMRAVGLHYRSGTLSQISHWDLQVLVEIASSLDQTSAENQIIGGECHFALKEKLLSFNVLDENEITIYLGAAKSYEAAGAYWESYRFLLKLIEPEMLKEKARLKEWWLRERLQGETDINEQDNRRIEKRVIKNFKHEWVRVNFMRVRVEVFKYQKRKLNLGLSVTSILNSILHYIEKPETRLGILEAINSWISKDPQRQPVQRWLGKAQDKSKDWVEEKKTTLFLMISSSSPTREFGVKFLSLTETEFEGWIDRLFDDMRPEALFYSLN